MARFLTAALQTAISEKHGGNPVVYVEIAWGGLIGTVRYADTIIPQSSQPRVLSTTPVIQQLTLDELGSVSSVTVVLSDNDLVLKDLTERFNIVGREASVYVTFQSLAIGDATRVVKGVITSPVSWNEEDRTLRFTIADTPRSEVIGVAPTTTAEVPRLHPEAEGKQWPVVFGDVRDVPAVRIRRAAIGQVGRAVLHTELQWELREDLTDPLPTTIKTWIMGGEVILGAFNSGTGLFTVTASQRNVFKGTFGIGPRVVGDPDEFNKHVFWILPGQHVDLVDHYVGVQTDTMDADYSLLNFVVAQHGRKVWCTDPFTVGGPFNVGGRYRAFEISSLIDGTFGWVLPSGAEARLYNTAGAESDYVAVDNISDATIIEVKAFRDIRVAEKGIDQRELVCVPPEFYEVVDESGIGTAGGSVKIIRFDEPLSKRNQGWNDESVFVSMRSGTRNTVAQIVAILGTYTNVTPEIVSFLEVQALILDYPSDFAIVDRMDALEAVASMAWQARVGLLIVAGVAQFSYLSTEPTQETFIVAEDVLLQASIVETTSESEDVVTVFRALWRRTYADDEPRQVKYENNISLYGTREEEFQFWIYQQLKQVEKSATFWSNRKSHMWRVYNVVCMLDALGVDVFDVIKMGIADIAQPLGVLGRAIEVQYGSDPFNVGLSVWTPTEAGEQIQSSKAYLTDVPGDGDTAFPFAVLPPCSFDTFFQGRLPSQRGVIPIGTISGADPMEVTVVVDGPNGLYDAVLYPEGFAGTPGDTVRVTDVVPGTPLVVGDRTIASKSEFGQWFLETGAADTSGLQAQIDALVLEIAGITRTFFGVTTTMPSVPPQYTTQVDLWELFPGEFGGTFSVFAHPWAIHPSDIQNIQIGTLVQVFQERGHEGEQGNTGRYWFTLPTFQG